MPDIGPLFDKEKRASVYFLKTNGSQGRLQFFRVIKN